MSTKRIVVIDLAKVVLSFLVINLHVESFVTHAPFTPLYFLGWYAVPLFVVFSFYFSSKHYLSRDISFQEFARKLLRFVIPFLFWSIIGFVIHPDLITTKYVLRQLLTGTSVDPPLYYLSTITIISALIYYARRLLFRDKYRVATSLIILLLLIESSGLESYFSTFIPIQIQLAVIRIFEFSKYAILGILMPSLITRLKGALVSWQWFALTLLALCTHTFYLWNIQVSDMSYGGFIQFTIVALVMITILTFKHFVIYEHCTKLIINISSYTLGIYCIHTFFVEVASPVVPSIILSLAIFFLSYAVAVGLNLFSSKYLSRVVT